MTYSMLYVIFLLLFTVDVERFIGLNVCSFNPIEVFAEILSVCFGQKCLLFSKIKEPVCIHWKTFAVLFLKNCEKRESLAQQNFPRLRYV